MSSENNEVIDLTDSFTLFDHCHLAGAVIELDESVDVLPPDSPRPERRTSLRQQKNKTVVKHKKRSSSYSAQNDRNKSSKGIGDCPVCWDELGKNPLASTKCGHVFCFHCIQQVVKQTKSCPTCRRPLKCASAFHPIYL